MAQAGTDGLRLDERARERLLAALRQRPRGLLSDIDGTLSAIAPSPEAATLLPGIADLLTRARQVFDVVGAISGRAAADAARLVGVPGILYIGNHGLERMEQRLPADENEPNAWSITYHEGVERYREPLQAVLDELEEQYGARWPGMRIEPKGVTGSIHVRGTADPEAAGDALARAAEVAALPHGLRVTRGKHVVELRPPMRVDKGTAIADLITAKELQGAIYLGDDSTDLDAFAALRQLTGAGVCRGVSVAVLHEEAPAGLAEAADVTLARIDEVPALLRWLIEQALTN